MLESFLEIQTNTRRSGKIMNLKHLSDDQLISKTKLLAKQERELLTVVLHHLSEVGRRRLFSALKFKSLFDYAVKELGYSEDQAYRRVKAAELLQQVPEIEEKIETGTLTLANLSVVASVVRRSLQKSLDKLPAEKPVKASAAEVRKIIELVEGKSKREAEVTLVREKVIDAEDLRPEKIKQVGESVEIRMTLRKEMLDTIEQLKSLMAHSDSNMSTTELFEKLCQDKLSVLIAKRQCVKVATASKDSRAPSKIKLQRLVWSRAKGQCENCKSIHALEVDHRHPKAKGGTEDLENLRLLCRSCNQRSAIEHFGREKMGEYLWAKE